MERGVETVSEASRYLSADLKARHPHIPWRNVADIGNVHAYQNVAPPVMWSPVRDHLPLVERVCREELAVLRATDPGGGQQDSDLP
ncbi:MAG TPA: HepT-like ribonuclease domain-containing protein [Acetobacteraceae bacterium]|nr:HepT-like ribonuclease domain-containing protein [Acetobacteraceae bacterium]